MLLTYDSIEEFARDCAKPKVRKASENIKDNFVNFKSYNEALDGAIRGDDSYASKAQAIIDKLDIATPEAKAFKRIRSPYGGTCNVGDYLAGSPVPMRRRVRTMLDTAELKIVVSVTCSAGIDAETMEKRGAAILALLMKLQTVRPIQLYLLGELEGKDKEGSTFQLIRVESQPLSLAVAGFALCHVSFLRHLCLAHAKHYNGFKYRWPKQYYEADYAAYRLNRIGETEESCLVIKEAYFTDTLVARPIEWITEQLKKYAKVEGE